MITFYLFVRAVRTGSLAWAIGACLGYFYMVNAWGGYIFIINIIPVYVLLLMITGHYSHRLYVAYSTFYVLGTLLSMQVRFVGFQAVQNSDHMGALGVFGLLQVVNFINWVRSHLDKKSFERLSRFIITVVVMAGAAAFAIAWITGCK